MQNYSLLLLLLYLLTPVSWAQDADLNPLAEYKTIRDEFLDVYAKCASGAK